MKQAPSQPCSAWATRLAARHPSDLSPADSADLQAHLQTCSACAAAHADYALMETAIRQLPPVAPLELLLSERFEEKSTDREEYSATRPAQISLRPGHSRSRRARVARLANLLAAVLVVGVLVAGFLIVFTRHSGGTQVGGSQVTSVPEAPSIAPQPIPSGLCENADPGLKSLCAQHQLTKIDSSKLLAGIPVTLAYAYADSNRVAILAFIQPSSPLSPTKQIMWGELTTTAGRYNFDGLGGSSMNSFSYMYYDAATVPAGTHTLHLRLKASFFDLNKSHSALASATFTFAVPFHPARIATPGQTITLGGSSITLDRVVISPSSARVYVHGGPNVPGSPTWLKVEQITIDGTKVSGSWRPSSRYTTDAIFDYDVSLYNQQGEWTFTITPPHAGSYTFHFVVPPAT